MPTEPHTKSTDKPIDKPIIWQGACVIEALQGTGPTQWNATGISIDTRTLQRGDLFIALRGPNFDGHHFIQAAIEQGACAIVVQDDGLPSGLDGECPIIRVTDTFQGLTQLAQAARKRFQGRILALTGSVGKTSTKDGLRQVLSQQGWTSSSLNSLNNHLGVPLSLARLPADARYAIFEVGMNHAGEITALIGLIQPHIALITQVSYQHGQFFSGIDGIVAAKAEIFSPPPPLLGILPHDSPHYTALRTQGQRNVTQWITFGCHPESHVRLVSHHKTTNGFRVTISINNQEHTYHWPLYGEHTVMNSLAIVAGSVALGADIHGVLADFALVTASQGRGTVQVIQGITVIDESYNAAPASVSAALKAFSEQKSTGKRYILLGEMRELGQQSHDCHSALIPLINACQADGIWLCGPAFQPFIQDITPWCTHGIGISDVMDSILNTLNPGDCILVKGANSMRTFALMDALKQTKPHREKERL